jgi:hypothetical protein
MQILEQALINLVINQISIIETHQSLAKDCRDNDLHNNIDSLGSLISIIDDANELNLSNIDADDIANHIAQITTKNLLDKTLSKES